MCTHVCAYTYSAYISTQMRIVPVLHTCVKDVCMQVAAILCYDLEHSASPSLERLTPRGLSSAMLGSALTFSTDSLTSCQHRLAYFLLRQRPVKPIHSTLLWHHACLHKTIAPIPRVRHVPATAPHPAPPTEPTVKGRPSFFTSRFSRCRNETP